MNDRLQLNDRLQGDLTDSEWESYMAGPYRSMRAQAKWTFNLYRGWNIALTIAALAGSAATSVGLTAPGTGIAPLGLCCLSWLATFAALALTAFGVKENKSKWEAIVGRLEMEYASLLALVGAYAATSVPRRLFIDRTWHLYLGLIPGALVTVPPASGGIAAGQPAATAVGDAAHSLTGPLPKSGVNGVQPATSYPSGKPNMGSEPPVYENLR